MAGSARNPAASSVAKDVSSARGAPSKTTIRSEAAPNFVKKLSRRLATSVSFGSSAWREVYTGRRAGQARQDRQY